MWLLALPQRSQMIAAWLGDEAKVKECGQLSLKISSAIEHENWRMYHEINTGYIRDHFHESKFLVCRRRLLPHMRPDCLCLSECSDSFLRIHVHICEHLTAHATCCVAAFNCECHTISTPTVCVAYFFDFILEPLFIQSGMHSLDVWMVLSDALTCWHMVQVCKGHACLRKSCSYWLADTFGHQVQMPSGKAWKAQNMTYFSLVSEFARRVSQVALVRKSPTQIDTRRQHVCMCSMLNYLNLSNTAIFVYFWLKMWSGDFVSSAPTPVFDTCFEYSLLT